MGNPLDVSTLPVPCVRIPSVARTTGTHQDLYLFIFFSPEKNIKILSPTGFWLFHASVWLPSAEEHCTVAPQQRSAFGEGHTETTAPPAGEMREDSFRLLYREISADQ